MHDLDGGALEGIGVQLDQARRGQLVDDVLDVGRVAREHAVEAGRAGSQLAYLEDLHGSVDAQRRNRRHRRLSLNQSHHGENSEHTRALIDLVAGADGSKLSFAVATGRCFAKVLSNMTFGLGYLMAVFTKRQQALHDLLAGTVVTRRV